MFHSVVKHSLKEKVRRLPLKPGVYIFKDHSGSILYIGKSVKLRRRVSSYFHSSANREERIQLMVSKVSAIEIIVTDLESEALILENNLIKKHQPRYNKRQKNVRTYPFICITDEERPRIFQTRTIINDGSAYYGPYFSALKLRKMLAAIRNTFNLCTCAVSSKHINRNLKPIPWGSCFEHYFGECSSQWNLAKYQSAIDNIDNLLSGKSEQIIDDLKEGMKRASKSLNFEYAVRLRDYYKAVAYYKDKIKVIDLNKTNRDVIGLYTGENEADACVAAFEIREGTLSAKHTYFLRKAEQQSKSQMLQTFIKKYYSTEREKKGIPDELCTNEPLYDTKSIERFFYNQFGMKICIIYPEYGKKSRLTYMAETNARFSLMQRRLKKQYNDEFPTINL